MYKPALLLLLVQLACLLAFSQDKSLDALLAEKNSKEKVDALHAYAQELLDVDNKKANDIYQQTMEISKALQYDLGVATAYRKTGYIHGQEGAYQEAINHFRKAIEYFNSGGGHINDLLVCYNNLGANFRQFGKVDSSMHYYLMAIKKIEAWPLHKEEESVKNDILSTLALLNGNMSSMYGNLYNIPKALEYGNKAIDVSRETKDTVRLVLSIISTSHAYYVNRDFSKALHLAREAATLADIIDAPVAQAKAYHLLSVNYTGLNKPDSGIYAAGKGNRPAIIYYGFARPV